MKSTQKRRDLIVKILENDNTIHTQDELAVRLTDYDIHVTQVTLSRDLANLHIKRRQNSNGELAYCLPWVEDHELSAQEREKQKNEKPVIVSIENNDCVFVVKTRAGYAQAVAKNIDEIGCEYIMGTVAGVDTVILISRDKLHNAIIKTIIQQQFNLLP